jgi:hypothetical protein
MRPRITINAVTYSILCFAGAGSYIMPGDLATPTAMAATPPPSDAVPLVDEARDVAPPLDLHGPTRAAGRDR